MAICVFAYDITFKTHRLCFAEKERFLLQALLQYMIDKGAAMLPLHRRVMELCLHPTNGVFAACESREVLVCAGLLVKCVSGFAPASSRQACADLLSLLARESTARTPDIRVITTVTVAEVFANSLPQCDVPSAFTDQASDACVGADALLSMFAPPMRQFLDAMVCFANALYMFLWLVEDSHIFRDMHIGLAASHAIS